MTAWANGRPILTADEMRAAEQRLFDQGMSVEALMARAGEAVAEVAWRHAATPPTLVLCGPGNNGGDGYVIARRLKALGSPVRVAALAEPRTDAARWARSGWDGPVETLDAAAPAPLLIDALFGTGLVRGLDPAVAGRLTALAAEARIRIAVDLPSGVATDDGALLTPGLPRFDLTVTLGALKPAHRLRPAADHMGRVVLADIGIPVASATLREVPRPRLSAPGPDDHKYRRGMVAVIGGAMPGAALLSATAAARSGAGYVVLAGQGGGGPMALVRREAGAILGDRRLGAVVVGPGLGRDGGARRTLAAAFAGDHPLVLDADALMLLGPAGLARIPLLRAMPVMTPHEGEFAALFPGAAGTRIERVRAAAAQAQAVIVLKGSDCIVAHPDGRAMIAPAAPAWLASAGTGDVLSGVIATMRAQGFDAFDAAAAGVWLHGEAARRAGPVLIADDLVSALPSAVVACL